MRTLGRERAKDTTLDYSAAFAERRGIECVAVIVSERAQQAAQAIGQAVAGRVAEQAADVRERAAQAYRAMVQAKEGGQGAAVTRAHTAQEGALAYRR